MPGKRNAKRAMGRRTRSTAGDERRSAAQAHFAIFAPFANFAFGSSPPATSAGIAEYTRAGVGGGRALNLRGMPIPRIAIVGRPNTGKSSLMNMIAGSKVSIVDPAPGVTRDRVTAIVDLAPPDGRGATKPVEFVDTGGFGVYVAAGERFNEVGADLATLTGDIEFQIGQAVGGADLVLFAVDAQAGITPQDREIARLLREQRLGRHEPGEKPRGGKGARPGPPVSVRVVATKVDGPKWEVDAHELAGLGFGVPLMCSATSNYFRRDFLDALYALMPEPEAAATERSADLLVAIIGRRNTGKSTLVNTLAGEERMIVSEIAGTTRDAVDVRFEIDGRSLVAIDTAGLRRKKSFQSMIEEFAYDRVKRAVGRADVVLLLLDATQKISQVDEQLAMLAQKAFKPVVIVVNKWDLAEGQPGPKNRPVTPGDFEGYLRGELGGLDFAPISFVSGKDGLNVRETIDLAFELHGQASARVTTGRLNRLVQGIMEQRGPTNKLGTRAKVYYVAQTRTNPPTIVLVVNYPALFTPNYQRFLVNRFRKELPFGEVPIRLAIRDRKRTQDRGVPRPGGTAEPGDAEARAALRAEDAADLGTMPEDAISYFEDEAT